MTTPTKNAIEALAIQPNAELTHAAVDLFGASMKPSCWSSPPDTTSAQAKIGMELGVYDVIGAYCPGPPPTFGKYANCHVERRCFECEQACDGEGALVNLATSQTRPTLIVLAGGSLSYPTWLRVVVIDPGKRWSGGIFIPVTFRHQRGVVLEPESGGTSLVVTAEELLVTEIMTGKPWLLAAFDRARLSFVTALRRYLWSDQEVTGDIKAVAGQGA